MSNPIPNKFKNNTMRRTHFNTAKRYLIKKRESFMTSMHGNGWILYKDRGEPIARVTHTPKTEQEKNKHCFYGNLWTNPSRL